MGQRLVSGRPESCWARGTPPRLAAAGAAYSVVRAQGLSCAFDVSLAPTPLGKAVGTPAEEEPFTGSPEGREGASGAGNGATGVLSSGSSACKGPGAAGLLGLQTGSHGMAGTGRANTEVPRAGWWPWWDTQEGERPGLGRQRCVC